MMLMLVQRLQDLLRAGFSAERSSPAQV